MDIQSLVFRKAQFFPPVLSNLYLNSLDHMVSDRGFEMVRYADDFVVLCRSESEAASALEYDSRLGGGCGPNAASDEDAGSLIAAPKSFVFLGYSFREEKIYPRRGEPVAKIKARIVKLTARNRT